MPNDILNNLTILLVDDEKFSRTVVAGMLADLGRPTILEAENGADALNLLSEHKVDFIISDFNMPIVHGLQLLHAVRSGKLKLNKPSTPFALLTGYSERSLVDKALALDTNAFLLKPVSKNSLSKRLSKMLKQSKSGKWVKTCNTYQAVSVDSVLDEITLFPNASLSTTPQAEAVKKDQPGAEREMPRPREFRMPSSGPIEANGHTPDTGPIEVRGLDTQYSPESGSIEVRGLDGQGAPDSGSIEVRGLDPQHIPDSDAIEVLGVEIESEHSKGGKKHLCPLDQLPEGAELALDIYTSQGTLFMFAGTKLSPRTISILYDLHELGHPVESIWIKDNLP